MKKKVDQELTNLSDLSDDELKSKRINDSIEGWYRYWNDNTQNGINDLTFALGNQWDTSTVNSYVLMQKVMLTMNVLYAYCLNVVGEQRQSSPQITVRSIDGKVPQKYLSTVDGMIRNISISSDADFAYEYAFIYSLICGWGAWRVVVDYENPYSFNKIAKIVPILDPFLCYWDPIATSPTKSDGNFCGCYTVMSKLEFKKEHPEISNPQSFSLPEVNIANNAYNYDTNENIIICEHFQKEFNKTKLYKLNTGDTLTKEEYEEKINDINKMRKDMMHRINVVNAFNIQNGKKTISSDLPKIEIIEERDTVVCIIKHYKAIKDHVLEESEFYGEELPIVYVDGDSHYIRGKQITNSFVRQAKDPQMLLNYNVSEFAQRSKNSRRQTTIGTEAMFAPYKAQWLNPEKPTGPLYIKPDVTFNGGTPIILPPEEIPQSLMAGSNAMLEMIQQVLGRYEANKGAQGNEISGVAISNRAKQGSTSIFIYKDNLNKAVRQTGRILLCLLPDVYNNDRYVPIKHKDGRIESVRINDKAENTIYRYNLDIDIEIGSSFDEQKAQSFSQMIDIIKVNPSKYADLLVDLLAQNTNLVNTTQIVDRLRDFAVPPAVIAKENGDPPPKQQPNPQLELAQAQSKAELMTAEAKMVDAITGIAETKIKANAELEKAGIEKETTILNHILDFERKKLKSENEEIKKDMADAAKYFQSITQ